MDKMNNKPIKQMGAIETSILNQSNTPLVPPQFQTGAYVDPTSVVQNPPVVPQPNMGNQMGATPIYQTDCEKYNLAVIEGWRVLRYTAKNVQNLDSDIKKLLFT